MKWTSYPLARIGIFFIGGILMEPLLPDISTSTLLVICLLYFSLLFLAKKELNLPVIQSFLLLAFSFVFGLYVHEQKNQLIQNARLPDKYLKIQCIVEKDVVKKTKYKTIADVLYFHDERGDKIKHKIRILLYFDIKDTIVKTYKKGDIIYVEGKINNIFNNTNPGAFDQQKFYKNKGILQQVFVKIGNHQFLGQNVNGYLTTNILNIRSFWNLAIQHFIKEPERRAIIKALLLGDQSEVENELFQSFSQTGAIHVLAVSGLHVGAVLYIFVLLFTSCKKRWIHIFFKPFLLTFFALSYVILTGASPSVIRAAIMFGMVIIGKEWFRNSNTINILFVSAIWMLLYDPYYIYDLSFQFSYLSLLSIILLQPQIKLWYIPVGKGTTYIWELISVSISAQILVFPLSMYYFNQFPVYFILSNIVAVPMAIFLVYGGFFIPLMFQLALDIGHTYAFLYSEVTGILIYFIQKIQHLPGALIKNVFIDFYQVLIWYVAIIYLLIYGVTKKSIHFYVFMGLVFLGSLPFYTRDIHYIQQKGIFIYESKKGHIIDFVFGKTFLVLKHEGVSQQTEEFTASKNRLMHGAERLINIRDSLNYSSLFFKKEKREINFCGLKIYVLAENRNVEIESSEVDYLLVGKGNKCKASFVLEYIKPDTIFLLSSVEKYKKESWQICAKENQIPLIDLTERGFYKIKAKEAWSN